MSQTTTWAVPSAPSGLAMRNTVNTIFDVLRSNSSGASAPSPTVAGMFWFDESVSPPVLRQRNAANTAWNRIIDTADLAASRTALGATATGSSLFTAADALAGRTAIGAEPIATLAAGPGQWVGFGVGTSSNLTLPAGGQWAFDFIVWAAGSGIYVNRVVNIAAGGTLLWTTSASQFANGFAKRIA